MEKSELRKKLLRARDDLKQLKQLKVDTLVEKERREKDKEILKRKIEEMENELYGMDKGQNLL